MQNDVDSIYHDFTTRVANGRHKDITYIDSIGQGRIWSGMKGLQLGLVDRIGGMQDAVDCAARMAQLKTYHLHEYPEPENFLDQLLHSYKQSLKEKSIREDLGEQGVRLYKALSAAQFMSGVPQARLPIEFSLLP